MIIEAAGRVLQEHGVHSVTLRSIARSAGVSIGTVTYHFASVREIVAAAFAQSVSTYYERLERRVEAESDPLAALELLIDGIFTHETRRHWQLWFDSLRLGGDVGELQARQQLRYQQWDQMLHALVTAGMAEGVFGCDDADHAVMVLVALVDGLALGHLRGGPEPTMMQSREHFRRAAYDLLAIR
jgi:AcrR family transcriptional regulator